MGAPDPSGIHLDLYDERVIVCYEVWRESNPKTRKARALRIMRLIGPDGRGWCCWWCGDEIPLQKRADARYCSETCRKARARERRRVRRACY